VAFGFRPKFLARPLAGLERYGFIIIIAALFLLPFLGRRIGFDLDVFQWLVFGPSEWLTGVILRSAERTVTVNAEHVVVADGGKSHLGRLLGRQWHQETVYGVASRAYAASSKADDPWITSHLELRDELSDYPFRSKSDSEVILAAFQKWGPACLDRFVGMFALTIWDEHEQSLFGARDRFGVKPMYYSVDGSRLLVASEIKSLHAAGVAPVEGWIVTLRVAMPGDRAFTVLARVIRTVRASRRSFWPAGMAVRFLDLPGDARRAIDAYVESRALSLRAG